MYISKKEYGEECLELAVEPEYDITDYGIGKQVQVVAVGTVKSARAPYRGIMRKTRAKSARRKPFPDGWRLTWRVSLPSQTLRRSSPVLPTSPR
jgi:hypothetical protein